MFFYAPNTALTLLHQIMSMWHKIGNLCQLYVLGSPNQLIGQLKYVRLSNMILYYYMWLHHSGYGRSQWEMTLHCNVISHWLRPYYEWSLDFSKVKWTCFKFSSAYDCLLLKSIKLAMYLLISGMVSVRIENIGAISLCTHGLLMHMAQSESLHRFRVPEMAGHLFGVKIYHPNQCYSTAIPIDVLFKKIMFLKLTTNRFRNHFVHASSQRETLQCNIISHWLGSFTKWSLMAGHYLTHWRIFAPKIIKCV